MNNHDYSKLNWGLYDATLSDLTGISRRTLYLYRKKNNIPIVKAPRGRRSASIKLERGDKLSTKEFTICYETLQKNAPHLVSKFEDLRRRKEGWKT